MRQDLRVSERIYTEEELRAGAAELLINLRLLSVQATFLGVPELPDLIQNLEEFTPRGIEHVKLYLRAQATAARVREEEWRVKRGEGVFTGIFLALIILAI